MHPPSRARRILKWTGVGLLIALGAIWIASAWCGISVVLPGNRAYVYATVGRVGVFTSNYDLSIDNIRTSVRNHGLGKLNFEMPFWGFTERSGMKCEGLNMPAWLPLLLTAIPTAWLWHRDRRLISSSPGHLLCLRCGYDLTGNTSGVCPECGDKARPPAMLADSECGEEKPPATA